ncbi:MAG: hypothetical protein LBJ67_15665 [Planctomycetaceae bacterium]|nr:hypothetical protein [Planctomycetaceae bacterium]
MIFCVPGCKTSDKGQSTIPFFGGNFSQSPLPQSQAVSEIPASLAIQPQPPIAVNPGMDAGSPAIISPYSSQPYDATQSLSTLPSNGTYAPPNVNPADNLSANPSSGISSPSTIYPDRVTVAYDVPPGTNVRAGEPVGTLPNAYSSSGTASANGTTYGGTSAGTPTSNPNLYLPTSTDNSTYGSPSSPYTSPYGGNSGQETSDYPNNSSTFNETKTRNTQLENGDYTALDGTVFRVIDGKAYTLVQYRESVPILPISTGETYGGISTSPSPISSLDTAKSSLSANQWTDALGKINLPSYDAIKQTQSLSSPDAPPNVVMVGDSHKVTILPTESATEAVPSLDASQYADIGTTTSSATTTAVADNQYNRNLQLESQNTVWSLMVRQDNNRLLFDVNNVEKLSQASTPKYFALSDPLVFYLNRTNFDTNINSPQFSIAHSDTESPLWNCPPMQTSTQSVPIILGQSPNICCPMMVYVRACNFE